MGTSNGNGSHKSNGKSNGKSNDKSQPRRRDSLYQDGVDGRKVPKPAYVSELLKREYAESQRRHWKRNFLRSYASNGNITRSLAQSGASRRMFTDARKNDPEFAEAFADAYAAATDKVLEAVWEIGVEGVREPIVWQGEIIGYKKTKDWKAAKFLLEARDPSTYSQRERVAKMNQQSLSQLNDRRDQMLEEAEARIKMLGGGGDPIDAEVVDD